MGAPLLGATVRIVDANGGRVGMLDSVGNKIDRVRTSTADGSYRLQLASPTPSVPLLIQVAGVDGSGVPIVLHSILTTTTLPQIANVSPATDAVVAQVLGVAPRTVFANAATAWPTMTLLGSATAVASASTNLKTIIASSLTDVKITDTKGLDFFQDSTFTAGKTGLDAAFEGLKFQIVKDNIGRDQLQISNKLSLPGVVEVKVDLAIAQTELAKGTSGSLLKSVISTLKIASSPNKVSLAALATLDTSSAAVNNLIAQGADAAAFLASPLLSSHKFQDGRPRTALADLLASYALLNQQLGRWQVTGCIDNPVPLLGCTRLGVSALVIDRAGEVVDVLSDTLGYKTTTTPNWVFVGNDRNSSARVMAVAQATLNLDGSLKAGATAPGNGLQVLVRPVDYATPQAQAVQSATIQVPSGYSVLYRYCGLQELCITPNAALNPVATGELKDTQLQKPAPGWVGSQDATRGAKYVASVTAMGTATEVLTPYLMADLPTDFSLGLFPKTDAPLSADVLSAGGTLNWRTWAEANPDMRLLAVRVITTNGGVAQVQEFPVLAPYASKLTLPALPNATTGFQVWLIALDSLGRRFYSQFSSAP